MTDLLYRMRNVTTSDRCTLCRHGVRNHHGVHTRSGSGSLYSAAESGKLRRVALLLLLGKDPDRADSFGITPLQVAAWNDHCKVVRKLSKHSADVNLADRVGHTALFKAIWKDCAGCVHCLLRAGATLDLTDYQGNTPLHLSCQLGLYRITLILLESGAGCDVWNKRGETPLFQAVSQLAEHCVQLLLEAGADPDLPNKDGVTSLWAVTSLRTSQGSLGVLAQLLEANCDLERRGRLVDVTHGDSVTATELAVIKDDVTCANILYRAGADLTRVRRWYELNSHLIPKSTNIQDLLRQVFSEPRSLKDMSRVVIRDLMRLAKCTVTQLPLPVPLQIFLSLQDLTSVTAHIR